MSVTLILTVFSQNVSNLKTKGLHDCNNDTPTCAPLFLDHATARITFLGFFNGSDEQINMQVFILSLMPDCGQKQCRFLSLVNNKFAVPLTSYWLGFKCVSWGTAWRERLSGALKIYLINPSSTVTQNPNVRVTMMWKGMHRLYIRL